MTTESAPAVTSKQELWRDLFDVSRRRSKDRERLTLLLSEWAGASALPAAALYRLQDGKGYLEASVGSEDFPETYSPRRPADQGTWELLELPRALVLYRGTALPSADDPLLMLAVAGLRLSRLKQRIRKQRFQANFRGVELEALYEVGLAIVSTLDLDELVEELLLRAVSLLDARRGALYLLEGGSYRLIRTIGGSALEEFAGETGELSIPRGEKALDILPGASFLEVVPIESDNVSGGLLVVGDKESRHGVGPFADSDRRTLSLFANQAGIALENAKLHRLALEKKRLEREMELAAEIQQQLLPARMPRIPCFEVIGWNRPAQQVGGDYYALSSGAEGRRTLVVADVTGKGMPAALLVSTFHSALSLLRDRMAVSPELVDRLNHHICESSGSNKFITMLLAELNPDSGRLVFVNAGHNPGLLIRSDGAVEQLPSSGPPLGLLPDCTYESEELELAEGDLLCLYSDGITECVAPDDEEYGLDRLSQLLFELRHEELTKILETIDRQMLDFAAGQAQADDQTVVLLRRC